MKNTKALQLLRVAYATHRRGEPEIAKDICALAMEDPSAAEMFEARASVEDLTRQVQAALVARDFTTAERLLKTIRAMDEGECVGEDCDEAESALSPGDFVEDPPAPDLAAAALTAAQVGQLTKLAAKIKAAGHGDLAGRITTALGL
jgi:hypothetical protein